MIQNKLKKLISIAMSLVMMATMFSVDVFAGNVNSNPFAENGKCGEDVRYEFESDTGSLTIYGTGDMYDYSDVSTFWGRIQIKSIQIDDGVTSIGTRAFPNCKELTSVNIPNSVTKIGWQAFDFCEGLTSISIPNSVTTIGSDAFWGCKGLTSVTIPDSVTCIGNGAFKDCKSLKEITIPGSVEIIEYDTFRGCKNLTNVIIEPGVKRIGNDAFRGCDKLKKLYLPISVEDIAPTAFQSDGPVDSYTFGFRKVVKDSYTGEFHCNWGLELLKRKKDYNFDHKTGHLTIGKDVEKCQLDDIMDIPKNKIKSVTIEDCVTKINNYVFSGCENLENVVIGSNVKEIGGCAFEGCTSLTSVTIGNSVTEIGERAFNNCTNLTSVTIGNSVTSIGEFAFNGCTSLDYINVDKNNTKYTSIDGVLFSKDETELIRYPIGKGREYYTIPDSVTSIGECAFFDCSNLKEITIPEGVKNIGYGAFSCKNLTSIIVDDKNSSYELIDGILFSKDKTLLHTYLISNTANSYTVPKHVTNIGKFAFANSNLEEIDIPNSVKTIDSYTFLLCKNLTSVTIPISVTSIGDNAFLGCTSLREISIPNSVIKIGECAFASCSSLSKVDFPKNINEISKGTFSGCISLKGLGIAYSNVEKIGEYAFEGCTSLVEFYLPLKIKNVDKYAFNNCTSLIRVYRPYHDVSSGYYIDKLAFAGTGCTEQRHFWRP